MRPLDFDAFTDTIRHTRNSSPEPNGLPDAAWTATGESRNRILNKACHGLPRGVPPPADFDYSLVVYFPNELGFSTPGIPSAAPDGARSITLSNTCHKLLAKAVNVTLERVAAILTHPTQRGFMQGREMMANVVEALSPTHTANWPDGAVPAIVLFDIHAAFEGTREGATLCRQSHGRNMSAVLPRDASGRHGEGTITTRFSWHLLRPTKQGAPTPPCSHAPEGCAQLHRCRLPCDVVPGDVPENGASASTTKR